MAGYQTIEALRPILHRGPVPTPVVNRELVRPTPVAPVEPVEVAPQKRRYTIVTGAMVKEMRERRASGETLMMIARRIGCTHFTVRRYTLDVELPPGAGENVGPESKFCEVEAKALRAEGLTYLAIGATLGCCEANAHRLVNGRSDRQRGAEPAVSKAVEFVARATGVPSKQLRAPLRGLPVRRDAHVSKARAILFWLAHQREDRMTFVRIGKSLGFADTTVMDGVRKTERAIEKLGLSVGSHPGKIVRKLWRGSWDGVPCAK